ncbi:hypothetical protein JTE90_015271 [Oedothorax gibbosus]|uniref:FHA domain-containing protein n=1 Tax=Oedothorax gibbosus TaxID=931172 RepID=A0AAV6UC56_9ARAC|nr:hypothetical protein JTE90_015271 [Oedothorax gibbosus]
MEEEDFSVLGFLQRTPVQMSAISDSSQEASNAGVVAPQTPVPSTHIFLKTETDEPQRPTAFQTPEVLKPSPLSNIDLSQKRRSSSRSIKRKKFDDELVESSLIKTSRPRPQSSAFPGPLAIGGVLSPSAQSIPSLAQPTSSLAANESFPVLPLEKRKARPSQKRSKKPKSNRANSEKDASRWKPADDLSLILSVQQTNDLEQVYRGVKFSSVFGLKDVQERWYSLLYNADISKPALFAIKQLNPETIAQIQSKVLLSEEEEKLIASMPSDKGSVETFQEMLDSNASVFLTSRTAKALHTHWSLMKQYNLLKDQSGQQPLPAENLVTFSDTEELLEDSELQFPKDPAINEETAGINRKHLSEIKQLENEIPKWQVLVDCVLGVSTTDFDSKTLAVLKGRIVRYLIQSREVTFGRSSVDSRVDIDLTLEGPSWKVSRRQGVIKLDNLGDFYLTNEGKRPIFVDGKPVLNGSKHKLSNNSVIELTVLRFIFIINLEAVATIKAKCSA